MNNISYDDASGVRDVAGSGAGEKAEGRVYLAGNGKQLVSKAGSKVPRRVDGDSRGSPQPQDDELDHEPHVERF